MSRLFHAAIESLKKSLLAEAGVVEDNVLTAVKSLRERDARLAQRVIEDDTRVDQMEVDLEQECLEILALYQPVAADLRFVVTVLKINVDLERIADLAVNLAERAEYLATHEAISFPFNLPEMSRVASEMLKRAIDALVRMDADQARAVRALDDQVDAIHRNAFTKVQVSIREKPEVSDCLIQTLSVAHNIERIGDLASGIAEDVIYMVEGDIVRHQPPRPSSRRRRA
ncbi:phosphate signaling complex protein PhoU [Kolteria novifilia]|uniref:phosphate signaling complex protein PhoU n=1 Tax=Kolteria novifilia TaxID=2527975 RepID=UPI003AF3E4BF